MVELAPPLDWVSRGSHSKGSFAEASVLGSQLGGWNPAKPPQDPTGPGFS